MAELGRLFKLAPTPQIETPEALWLGLKPEEGQMRQGPLTVAALGADPPDRSTHFHVTPMSLRGDQATELVFDISPDEMRPIVEQANRLNTRTITFVAGENKDHGMVWEGLGDMRTRPPSALAKDGLRASLPEGDAEVQLRRFIDDSVNLLSDLELNYQREEEGLPPINLLWPWGHGVRKGVTNLAIRRGEPAEVLSASLRLAGLSRLAGYRHGDRSAFGNGMNVRLDMLGDEALKHSLTIVVIEAAGYLAARGMSEELHWLMRQTEDRLLKRLFDSALKSPARVALLVPGANGGLGSVFQTGDKNSNSAPFDERALEEKLPTETLWEQVERASLLPSGTTRSSKGTS